MCTCGGNYSGLDCEPRQSFSNYMYVITVKRQRLCRHPLPKRIIKIALYSFTLISILIFSELIQCSDTPCQNEGSCTDTDDGGHTCSCTGGYSGLDCETGKQYLWW